MPFASEKQRKYLWANEPAIAERWTEEAKESGSPIVQAATDKKEESDKTEGTLSKALKGK